MQNEFCNIDKVEKQKRLTGGIIAGIFAIALSVAYLASGSALLLITSFLFWFLASLGYWQWRLNFCAYFGFLGVDKSSGSFKNSEKSKRRKELMYAARVVFYSFLTSAIITVLVLIPG